MNAEYLLKKLHPMIVTRKPAKKYHIEVELQKNKMSNEEEREIEN